jgi:hypothetical protein
MLAAVMGSSAALGKGKAFVAGKRPSLPDCRRVARSSVQRVSLADEQGTRWNSLTTVGLPSGSQWEVVKARNGASSYETYTVLYINKG